MSRDLGDALMSVVHYYSSFGTISRSPIPPPRPGYRLNENGGTIIASIVQYSKGTVRTVHVNEQKPMEKRKKN